MAPVGRNPVIAAIWHRLAEWASLASCWLNVLRGGQREMTLSAESYWRSRWHDQPCERLRAAKLVAAIDAFFLRTTGQAGHCEAAWLAWCEFVCDRLAPAGWRLEEPCE